MSCRCFESCVCEWRDLNKNQTLLRHIKPSVKPENLYPVTLIKKMEQVLTDIEDAASSGETCRYLPQKELPKEVCDELKRRGFWWQIDLYYVRWL